MKIKRILSVLLCTAITVAALTGCKTHDEILSNNLETTFTETSTETTFTETSTETTFTETSTETTFTETSTETTFTETSTETTFTETSTETTYTETSTETTFTETSTETTFTETTTQETKPKVTTVQTESTTVQTTTSKPQKTTDTETTADKLSVEKDGSYTTPEDVAEYIHTFGTLPKNFITKSEAKALGWDNKKGNLWDVAEDKSIGGDYFGNYEGLLPDKKGRKYTECDVNYSGGYRGSERIIFSNDGLVYYTNDHYQTFTQLY